MHLEDFPEQNSGETDGPSGENLLSTLGPLPENLKMKKFKIGKIYKKFISYIWFYQKGQV